MSKNDLASFWLENIMPDSRIALDFKPKSRNELRNSATVILDANVLLELYLARLESVESIGVILKTLAASGKLKIPGWAVKEFARNRQKKLMELVEVVNTIGSKFVAPPVPDVSVLETLDQYRKLTAAAKALREKKSEFTQMVERLRRSILDWRSSDPVSLLYSEIITESVILDLELTKERRAKIVERSDSNIPPGYKDKSKDINPFGDIIIWETIAEFGENVKEDVIFVTGEQKPDWLELGNDQLRLPRSELVFEYSQRSSGCTFDIWNFQDFLKAFGATQEIVDEVSHIGRNAGPLHKLTADELIDKAMSIVGAIREGLEAYEKTMRMSSRIFNDNNNYMSKYESTMSDILNRYENLHKVAAILSREEFMARLGIQDDKNWRFRYDHPTNTHGLRDIADDLERMCQLLDHLEI